MRRLPLLLVFFFALVGGWAFVSARGFARELEGREVRLKTGASPASTASTVGVARALRQPSDLPEPLGAFVQRALGARSPDAAWIALEQTGEMRQSPTESWRAFEARELLSAGESAFLWHASFPLLPLLRMQVVDCLLAGRGSLEARLERTLRILHSDNDGTLEGQLARYLGELAWCPQAFLANPALSFEAVDASRVRARAEIGEIGVALTYIFDAQGDLVAVEGSRKRAVSEGFESALWTGTFSDYREWAGLRLPSSAEVSWEAEGELFVYWRASLTSVELPE